MSLRNKMSLMFVSIICIVSIAIGYASYYSAQRLILENKRDDMANTVNLIDINITEQIRTINEFTNYTSENLQLQKIAGEGIQGELDGELLTWFQNLSQSYKAISNIYTLNQDLNVTYQYKTESMFEDTEQLRGYCDKATKKTDRDIWSGLCSVRTEGYKKKSVVMLTKAITNPKQNNVIGFLVIEFDPDSFAKLLINNLSTFQHQHTLIIDKNHDTICTNNSVQADYTEEAIQRFDSGERQFDFHWANTNYHVCGQYNGITGWTIYSIISSADIFPKLTILRKQIIYIVILFLLVSFIMSIILAYTLTKPMKKLSEAMKVAEKGEFNIQIVTRRKDEIGSLIRSFNYMINEIKLLIQKVYEEKITQKNAELGALQAQINPHFLYNTLDTINWMLIERGEDDISDIVLSLGDLMKYSIQGDNMVTLQDEIDYVESYIRIQKCRMEDRLNYSIDIPQEARIWRIPKLTLQPIVENAITHGIETKPEGGSLKISAWVCDDKLSLQIKDDGVGISEDDIQKIQSGQGNSIGMHNVQKRIQLHYGTEYGLKIISKKDIGTEITMWIPKESSE